MLNRFTRALLALALVVGFVVASGAPAQAARSDCPAAKLCTFWDWDYKGAHYDYTSPTGTCIEIGYPWDDETSSIVNNRSIPVRFYVNHGCSPNFWDLSLHPNSANSGLALCCSNDEMSSFYISWSPPGGLNY